jgi:hypothetical protein
MLLACPFNLTVHANNHFTKRVRVNGDWVVGIIVVRSTFFTTTILYCTVIVFDNCDGKNVYFPLMKGLNLPPQERDQE